MVAVLEGNEKSGRILEVFDDVQAFLSDKVVRSIPNSIEAFFQENGIPGELRDVSDTCQRYLIRGSFLDILTTREILQKHVLQQDLLQQDVAGLDQLHHPEEVSLSIAFQDQCVDTVASHEVIGTNEGERSPGLAVEEETYDSSNQTTLLVNVVKNQSACGEFCTADLQHSFEQVQAAEGNEDLIEKDQQVIVQQDLGHVLHVCV